MLTLNERRCLDLLASHPDWSNDDLARALRRSAKYVEKLLAGACEEYGVRTRTGVVVAHREARRKRVVRDAVTEGMGL